MVAGKTVDQRPPAERVLLLCPELRQQGDAPRRATAGRMEEAEGLVSAAALTLVSSVHAPISRINPPHYIGSGKAEELLGLMEELEVSLVVMDASLTPVQQRNLEKLWNRKVIDRTALIIEIFGQRARTREGQLQVELASLQYQKGRLVRAWSHLERQRGGGGFTGGPGERQIELDKRMIRDRIGALQREIAEVRKTRDIHRKKRREAPYPVVALVGYTNAGKSTLFNRMTGADVYAKDKLFATLDPTLRKLRLPSGMDVMLSDTVGFISNLPTQLIAAFRATLEEVLEASLILHVRDIAHPESDIQKNDVETVLKELNIPEETMQNRMECWNKVDLLSETEKTTLLEAASHHAIPAIPVSAISGEGIGTLQQLIEQRLHLDAIPFCLRIPPEEGALIAWLRQNGQIQREHRREDDHTLEIECALSSANLGRLLKKMA